MSDAQTVIKLISGERFTPYALARKLGAAVLLESATFEGGRARYSLLMVEEAFRVFQTAEGVFFQAARGGKPRRIKGKAHDILDVLRHFSDQHHPPKQDFPFPAGGIGFLSYEFARHVDTIKLRDREDPLGLPEAAFLFGHVLIVFDHYSDVLYLIGLNYREHTVDLEAAIARTEAAIHDLNFNYLQNDETPYPARVVGNDDRAAFEAGVLRVRDEVIAGNLLQGVLSRRLVVETDIPAIEAYRRLRSTNPAPYLVYLDFGSYQLFAASPEVHVKVKGNHALMRPIAGTRRRGADATEDQELERELLADEKECAEHLMLVDLCRNDLGRVARAGSVKVTQFQGIERYSRVMHIVSQVECTLAEGVSGIEALRATFPAGTVSGAPKIRAIETIDLLEPHRRGFYAGAVGYLEPGGSLDTCITIRAALKQDGKLYLQAGAGVVYDSKPEREFEETNEKLSALARAVGLEVRA